MAESVYKVIELVGTSTESWEKAAAAAIKRASKSLRDLRVAEVSQLDMAEGRQGRELPGKDQGFLQVRRQLELGSLPLLPTLPKPVPTSII